MCISYEQRKIRGSREASGIGERTGMNSKRRYYNLILAANVLVTVCYLVWRTRYTLVLGQGIADCIVSLVFLLTEFLGFIFLWTQLFAIKRTKTVEVKEEKNGTPEYPEVDIFVINKGGNQKEAYNTINACLLMDYPDKNKVHIMPVNGGIEQLNEVFEKSDSPLVAVIQAGLLPRHEFLTETVPFFLNKHGMERIGFVQTALGYFNADSYQFRLFSQQLVPNEMQYFFKCQQPVFDRHNSVICYGSGAVFSREALEETGGFDAEGAQGYLETGIQLLKKGYRCRYVNKNLVSGFFDSDIATCIMKHKIRAAGAINAMHKEHIIIGKGLHFKQRINLLSYVASLAGPIRSSVNILIPVLFAVLGISVIEADAVILSVFWLLIYASADICLYSFSGRRTSLKWQQIYERSVSPFLVWPCIKAHFGKYKPVPIDHIKANKLKNSRYFIPHITYLILSAVAFFMCLNTLIESGSLLCLVFGIWLFVNIYYELMSVFWLIGRPYARQEDRVEAHISYELSDKIQTIYGMTRDLSSRGISVWCDRPYDIDDTEVISVKLNNGRYQANMEGNVIGVERDKGRWKYIILFQNMETFKQQYYGILYDRKPTETSVISRPQNMFSDLKRNIGNRFSHKTMEYRSMVRIPVNRDIKILDGESIFVKNYNYKFLIVRADSQPDEKIIIVPVQGVELWCERIHRFGEHIYQYKVLNYEKIRTDPKIRELLYKWAEQCVAENAADSVTGTE